MILNKECQVEISNNKTTKKYSYVLPFPNVLVTFCTQTRRTQIHLHSPDKTTIKVN